MPPPPNFSANFFVVRILSDEGDDEYTWQEAWYKLDGTLAVKDGGRYGGTSNPGFDVLATGFTAGDFAFCRSAEAHGGLVFELYPIGSNGDGGGSGTGNCVGDGWRIGLTEDDDWALRVLPDGESVYVEDGATVEINGIEYAITFDYEAGTLTLTPPVGSGEPIVGVLDCTACPCFRFAFPRSAFFPEEPIPANPCDRILYATVCYSCPAGWYCVRPAGSPEGVPYAPRELAEGEACSGELDVAEGGPYEDEDAAEEDCPITPVEFGPTCDSGEAMYQSTTFAASAGASGPSVNYLRIDTMVIGFKYRVFWTRFPAGNSVAVAGHLETGGGFPSSADLSGTSGCFEIDLGPTIGGVAGYYCLQFSSDGTNGPDTYTFYINAGACP